MSVQTEQEVRRLVDFAPEDVPVTSLYLNVDAAEFPDSNHIEKSFDSVIHAAESRRKEIERGLSHEAEESIREDLARIREFVTGDFNRKDTNGLAIFSCSAHAFWKVFQMETPVENRIEFGPTAYVAPIARFLSHSKPTAILVTDKQQARIFTMEGGEVREWTDFEDFVPHRTSQGGWSQNRYQRHSDNFAKHHIDRAAELTLRLLQHYPFDWLILGTEEQYENEVKKSLHPYLKDRVVGTIHVRIDAPASEIVQKASELREQVETQHIDQLLQQVQEYAGAGGRGTIGLRATLQALNEQKVHILLVQDGYRHPGSVCVSCGLLMEEQRDTCPACNEPARPVDDVVDEAIQRALGLDSVVEVATEYEKLQPIQYIGSIMYY
ncbi:MAG TPA: Vms1/Ankzf1 family peptidyl-tRNA hydrolase [Chloroflexota bacterium]